MSFGYSTCFIVDDAFLCLFLHFYLLPQGRRGSMGDMPIHPVQCLPCYSFPGSGLWDRGEGWVQNPCSPVPWTDAALVLASPKLAMQLYFVCCEAKGNLQVSSFLHVFQNKGVVDGKAVHRARCSHEWLVRGPQGYSPCVCPVRGGDLRTGIR